MNIDDRQKEFRTQPKRFTPTHHHHHNGKRTSNALSRPSMRSADVLKGRGASRGGGRGGRGGGAQQSHRKENILDLSKYQDKQIRVRFTGGREGSLLLTLLLLRHSLASVALIDSV